jgi:hypothetical protein
MKTLELSSQNGTGSPAPPALLPSSGAYQLKGYQQAMKLKGDPGGLVNSLNAEYENYCKSIRNQELEQQADPRKLKSDQLKQHNVALEHNAAKIRSERIPALEADLGNLREERDQLIRMPENHLGCKPDKTSFWLGLCILILLTGYLVVFYISASYSAFFRVFAPGVNLREAMLAPDAFAKALSDGAGELLFILLMPSLFLGLGWLIHAFSQAKSLVGFAKVGLLLSVAFVFDGFLAYKIAEGIDSVNQTLFTEEYTISKAFGEVNFWVVIFCGFVAYIVWGLVLDFVLQSNQQFDRLGVLLRLKNRQIAELDEAIFAARATADSYLKKIADNNLQIAANESARIQPVISPDEIARIHHQFMTGWRFALTELGQSPLKMAETDQAAVYSLEAFKYKLLNSHN